MTGLLFLVQWQITVNAFYINTFRNGHKQFFVSCQIIPYYLAKCTSRSGHQSKQMKNCLYFQTKMVKIYLQVQLLMTTCLICHWELFYELQEITMTFLSTSIIRGVVLATLNFYTMGINKQEILGLSYISLFYQHHRSLQGLFFLRLIQLRHRTTQAGRQKELQEIITKDIK